MQQAGTLRKRVRRNIAKVKGLSAVPYEESKDEFSFYYTWPTWQNCSAKSDTPPPYTIQTPSGSLADSKTHSRITRDPSFHGDFDLENPIQSKSASKRPFLLEESAFAKLRIVIFLGMMTGVFPWVWNSKKHTIERWSAPMVKAWKICWLLTFIQTTVLLFYHLNAFAHLWSHELTSYRGVFAYFLCVYWYVFSLINRICSFKFENQIREYINTLQNFNRDYTEKYVIFMDSHCDFANAQMIIHYAIPAGLCQLVNSLAFFLFMPYLPVYLTSQFMPGPWYWLIPGAIQDLNLVCQVALIYCMTAWLITSHTSSVEFWLRESHNNYDSDYTIDELRDTNTSLHTYRALQVLCTAFNDCMSPIAVPIIKLTVGLGLIPCGFILLRSMNHMFLDEFPGIMVYPFGIINCTMVGFGCLSMAAEMYDISSSYTYSWSLTKQKDLRRILMSFPRLTVKVGRFYVVTAATTITFFRVVTDFIINCIITFP